MENQPVVRIFQEFFGNGPHQSIFHCANGLSGRNTRAVTDPKNVGIDCHGEFTKGGIENHIGRFAANPWERFEGFTLSWDLSSMVLKQL
jgi:hypothetical protein